MAFNLQRNGMKTRRTVGSDGRVAQEHVVRYLATDSSAFELNTIGAMQLLGVDVGSPLVEDPNATLGDIDVDRMETIPPYCAWSIELKYSTSAKVPDNDSQDPTQQRVKRFRRFRELSRFIIRDRLDSLVVNAAGEAYPGGVPVTDYPNTFVYEWARSVPTNKKFHKSLNQNLFNGCDPKTLLCLITAEEYFEGAYQGWRETIEMLHDPLGWQPKPVNAGLKQLDAGGKLVDCLDGNEQPFHDPQPLYDSTASLPHFEGQMIPAANRPADCVFVEVDYFDVEDFAKIGVQEFP